MRKLKIAVGVEGRKGNGEWGTGNGKREEKIENSGRGRERWEIKKCRIPGTPVFLKIKKPATSYSRTGGSRTTLGDGALNFRVRNGNGCDSSSMVTGKKA